jgi:hypothetical protein
MQYNVEDAMSAMSSSPPLRGGRVSSRSPDSRRSTAESESQEIDTSLTRTLSNDTRPLHDDSDSRHHNHADIRIGRIRMTRKSRGKYQEPDQITAKNQGKRSFDLTKWLRHGSVEDVYHFLRTDDHGMRAGESHGRMAAEENGGKNQSEANPPAVGRYLTDDDDDDDDKTPHDVHAEGTREGGRAGTEHSADVCSADDKAQTGTMRENSGSDALRSGGEHVGRNNSSGDVDIVEDSDPESNQYVGDNAANDDHVLVYLDVVDREEDHKDAVQRPLSPSSSRDSAIEQSKIRHLRMIGDTCLLTGVSDHGGYSDPDEVIRRAAERMVRAGAGKSVPQVRFGHFYLILYVCICIVYAMHVCVCFESGELQGGVWEGWCARVFRNLCVTYVLCIFVYVSVL